MTTPEDIQHQKELLEDNRRRLKYLLKQKTTLGTLTPYHIEHDISETRENIKRIKSILYKWGVEIEDHPDDDDPDIPNSQITQSEPRPTNHNLVKTQEEDVPPNNKNSLTQSSSKEKSIDFEDSVEWEKLEFEGNLLIVTKPKVKITFHIPYAFEDAKCEVEFSSLELNRVKVYLNHTDILGQLMSGLDTSPDSGARRFINKANEDLFEARLGQIQITLQQDEALDLCACIDIVCGEYKKVIMEAENMLETENFLLMREESIPGMGFLMISIQPELWDLMCRFTLEFDYRKGNSEWHIFDGNSNLIHVSKIKESFFPDHTIIHGKKGRNFTDNYIHLIYGIPSWRLKRIDDIYGSWQNNIGTYGIWTATHTKNWLLNEFIPTVHQYYCKISKSDNDSVYDLPQTFDVKTRASTNKTKEELEKVDQPDQLNKFINDLHFGFSHLDLNVKSSTLIGFFESFLELAEDVVPSTVNTGYILGCLNALRGVSLRLPKMDDSGILNWDYSDALHCISNYISHIRRIDFVPSDNIELILRVLGAIIEGRFARIDQSRLNTLKKHMIPLWQEADFENRYVIPHRWNI